LKTTILKGSTLSLDILEAWAGQLQANSNLASLYFAPAFNQIVASARGDVEVAVVEDDGNVVALFPYQRGRFDVAGPVGEFISDYHGLISGPSFSLDPRELLQACGLVAWDFNHFPVSQASFAPFHREQHRSPIIDLSTGYEAYVKERREAGTEQIKKKWQPHAPHGARSRPSAICGTFAGQENIGAIAGLENLPVPPESLARPLFHTLRRNTIERIHATQTPDFAGVLSVLYAGDQLVAAHFGMRSSTVWHYWFPTFDHAFSKYSPRVMLLLKMPEAASTVRIKTIDLGTGEHSDKWRLMNGFVATDSGSVALTGPVTLARRVWSPIRKLPYIVRYLTSKNSLRRAGESHPQWKVVKH
jgi:CelD/BcsL family acetyltransferase involved in cellulose biosynthesis